MATQWICPKCKTIHPQMPDASDIRIESGSCSNCGSELPQHPSLQSFTQRIRESTPEDYNLAMEVPLDYNIYDPRLLEDFLSDGCLVLKEASGPLGVLRAMEVRRQGILARMDQDGGTHRILHMVFEEKSISLHSYTFEVKYGG